MDEILKEICNLPNITLNSYEASVIKTFLKQQSEPTTTLQKVLKGQRIAPSRIPGIVSMALAWLKLTQHLMDWQINVADIWIKRTGKKIDDDQLAHIIYHLLPPQTAKLFEIKKKLDTIITLDNEIIAALLHAITLKLGENVIKKDEQTTAVLQIVRMQNIIYEMALTCKFYLNFLNLEFIKLNFKFSLDDVIEDRNQNSNRIPNNPKLELFINKYQIAKSVGQLCANENVTIEQKIAGIKSVYQLHGRLFEPFSNKVNDWIQPCTFNMINLNFIHANSLKNHDDFSFFSQLKKCAHDFSDVQPLELLSFEEKQMPEDQRERINSPACTNI